MAWNSESRVTNQVDSDVIEYLTNDTNDPTTIDSTKFDACMAPATAKVKAYCQNRYPTEIAAETANDLLAELELCLFVFNVHCRHISAGMTQIWLTRIEKAEQMLEMIRDGGLDVYGASEDGDSIAFVEHEYPDKDDSFSDWETDREDCDF